ncbi:MAG: glycosyltransferase [Anaerolineaceae bacterium]|nr:glycosyltransferase [Anaerolineaceae bacterium]
MNIAYMMSRFPHLPETFILREMTVLQKRGWKIYLYPLICQDDTLVHTDAQFWLKQANCLPFFSWDVFKKNLSLFLRNPFLYLSTIFQVFFKNLPSVDFLIKAITLFPKSVALASMMQTQGIEHIHAHYATHPALAAWIIKKLTGISYSLTVHAHDIYVNQTMLSTKLKDALFIAAISEFNRDFLAEKVGEWAREKTHIVHCGIQPEWYAQKERNKEQPVTFKLINVGSLQPYKGQIYLIDAVKILHERGVPVQCRIIGDGAEKEKLQQRILHLGLENEVELMGARTQSEVADMMPQADCYVQPSIIVSSGKMEGIPVVLMEALACGLPVVSTKISGIPELIREGESGYLVSQKDSGKLADILMKVWENLEAANQMGETGRQIVLKEFDLNKNVGILESLFHQYGFRINQNKSGCEEA